jgi:hypothetical protein
MYQQQNQGGGRSETGRTYNDQLVPIASFGFPANHLLNVGLMQRIPPPNLNYPDLKEKFFFFVTLAPGINEQGGGRTYDFKQGKTTLKFASREIAGLANILRQCGIGNDANVLPYTKFSKSGQNSKNVSVWISNKQSQQQGVTQITKQINLSVQGAAKNNISLSSGEALAMSDMLMKLFDKAIELEINQQIMTPAVSKTPQPPPQQQASQYQQQQPQQQFNSPPPVNPNLPIGQNGFPG